MDTYPCANLHVVFTGTATRKMPLTSAPTDKLPGADFNSEKLKKLVIVTDNRVFTNLDLHGEPDYNGAAPRMKWRINTRKIPREEITPFDTLMHVHWAYKNAQ